MQSVTRLVSVEVDQEIIVPVMTDRDQHVHLRLTIIFHREYQVSSLKRPNMENTVSPNTPLNPHHESLTEQCDHTNNS